MAERGRPESEGTKARARRWFLAVFLITSTLAAAAYVLPRGSRNPLVETTVWSLLVIEAFAGWGSLVRHIVARRERIDLGLRVIWGASAVCGVGGLLTAMSLMTRNAAFLVIEAGLVLAIAALVLERDAVRSRVRLTLRLLRTEPRLAVMVGVVAGMVVIQYLAGIAEYHTNPYDDDIAYLAFTKKLLDTGGMVEPFSLRRLSALGGQILFVALVSLRAAPSQAHTFDRSICVVIIVLLIIGFRTRGTTGRRVPWVVSLLTIALLLILPNAAINTASYYSGVAFFLGLFRTILWLERGERRPWQGALPIALVGAATCTLRQNYVTVPAAILAFTYGFRFVASKAPWRQRLVEPAIAAGLALAALVPWFVTGWQSNRTFLYPVMLGTANPAMSLQGGAQTIGREIHLQIWTAIDGLPLKTMALFVLAATLVREKDPRKPLWSAVLGCAVGFVALVHGLSQGDAGNLGRYSFGYLIALALLVVLVTTSTRLPKTVGREHVAAGLVMFGVLAGLVESRGSLRALYDRAFMNIEVLAHNQPRSPQTDPPEVGLYARLQSSIPEHARLAVMLDEPYHLDFKRNPIWNLDMPGYSSLAPGLPYFEGPERVAQYFRGLGVRYLSFVRVGYSRYHYRRDYWVQTITDEQEIWRVHAPYLLDFVDNLTALDARHPRVFDERGLVVIDLEAVR